MDEEAIGREEEGDVGREIETYWGESRVWA